MKMLVAGKFDGKNYAVQNMNLQCYNGSLYMTGLITGSLSDDGSTTPFIATTTRMREAMIVKADAQSGKRLAAGIDGKSITSAYAVVETNNPNTVWVYGYDLFSKARLNKYTLSEGKLVKENDEIVIVGANMGMLGTPLIDGNAFVSTARPRGSSGTILGVTDASTDFYGWGIVLTKHTCDDILADKDVPTGIQNVNVLKNKASHFDVFTLAGVCVKRAESMDEAVDGLPSGLYIIGGKKVGIS